ncbi:MAG: hypothetical protein WC460_03660 [Patescibacteria group bacterium]
MIRKFLLTLAKISLIFIITILGALLILPAFAHAEDTFASLNVMAKDSGGIKVSNVSFNIYEQKYDINNNKILGDRISGGYIGDTGLQTIQIKNTSNITKVVAFEYHKNDRNYERFVIYDIKINGLSTQDVNLVLSSVEIILRDADNNLLKDLPFQIWSATTDVAGNIVAKDQLYGYEKTEVTGAKTYYLIPGNYILRINYPDLNNINALDNQFTVNLNQQTDLSYTLNTLIVSARDFKGDLTKNAEFKLFYENDDNDFVQIGQFNTGDKGTKKLFLPRGDYKIEFKDNSGDFNTIYDFSLSQGDKKEFNYNYGSLRLKILDTDKDPVPYVRVIIYRFTNNQRQGQIYSNLTDINGTVEIPLSTDYYQVEIQGPYNGLTYLINSIYVNENSNNYIEYVLSKARIYLQDLSNQNVKNTAFTLYFTSYDAEGNLKPGSEIGTFSTTNSGFADISLPAGRYIIKLVGSNNIYPISVGSEKLNALYIPLRDFTAIQTNNQTTNSSTNNSTVTQNTQPAVVVSTVADSLYNLDTDNDGLADFEEYYIYNTDPFKPDTDGDGYNDGLEVSTGYNPLGSGLSTYKIFSYGKPRVNSPSLEKDQAALLYSELVKRIGRNLGVAAKDWHTIVNSYIYGGYSIDEIKDTLNYGPGLVHPTFPAKIWRNSIQYSRSHH